MREEHGKTREEHGKMRKEHGNANAKQGESRRTWEKQGVNMEK